MSKNVLKHNFNWYKENISLPDFLETHFHFSETSKSRNGRPIQVDGGGIHYIHALKSQEDSTKHFVYFHPSNFRRAYTILDFMVSHLNSVFPYKNHSLIEAAQEIDKLIEKVPTLAGSEKTKFSVSEANYNLADIIDSLRPVYKFDFFRNRGIEDWVVKSPVFSDCVKTRKHTDVPRDKTYYNTVFVMRGLTRFDDDAAEYDNSSGEDIRSIAQRDYHATFGPRANALCISWYDKSKPLDAVVFSETQDDNMSYYQMFNEELNSKNICYIASQGQISEGQLVLLEKIIEHWKPSQFIVATDRDAAGERYCTEILGTVSPKNVLSNQGFLDFSKMEIISSVDNVQISPENQFHKAFCRFNFPVDNRETGVKSMKLFNDHFDEFNKFYSENFGGYSEDNFKIAHEEISDKMIRGRFEFINKNAYWRVINSFLLKHKFDNKFFVRHRPILKDFNEDLQAIKGIHKEFKIQDYKTDPKLFSKKSGKESKLNFKQLEFKQEGQDKPMELKINHDFSF